MDEEIKVRPAYQQRVIEEKRDLDTRLDALEKFTAADSKLFKTLPDAEQVRMHRQLVAMHSLSTILGERIAAFPEVQSTDAAGRGESFWQADSHDAFKPAR